MPASRAWNAGVRQRQAIDHIASAASFIVNRVHVLVDVFLEGRVQQADEMQRASLKALEGGARRPMLRLPIHRCFSRDTAHALAEVLQLVGHEEARLEGIDEDRPTASKQFAVRVGAGAAVMGGAGHVRNVRRQRLRYLRNGQGKRRQEDWHYQRTHTKPSSLTRFPGEFLSRGGLRRVLGIGSMHLYTPVGAVANADEGHVVLLCTTQEAGERHTNLPRQNESGT